MTKVSVIVPVYNEERYIQECLNSLCNQTLKEIEIICVDDGSTDKSLEILNTYASKDNRIKVLTQKNQFAGAARNYGMQYASGKYIYFLDADDYVEHNLLEKMYDMAEKEHLDIVLCHFHLKNELCNVVEAYDFTYRDSFLVDKDVFSGKDLREAGVFQIVNGWPWDKLFRTDFIKECGYEYPTFRSSEDGFFVYMLMARAARIGVTKANLVYHRTCNKDSLSNTLDNNWENGFVMLKMIRDELIVQNLYKVYEQSFLNFVLSFSMWYLDAMHRGDSFEHVYTYIREEMESAFGLLQHADNYFWLPDLLVQYKKVVKFSVVEYLYEKNAALKQTRDSMVQYNQSLIAQLQEKTWAMPFLDLPKDRRVILYGAGKIGQSFYKQLVQSQYCKKLYWVDKEFVKYKEQGLVVESVDIISHVEYDYVYIAIKKTEVQNEVNKFLVSVGVPVEKMIVYK